MRSPTTASSRSSLSHELGDHIHWAEIAKGALLFQTCEGGVEKEMDKLLYSRKEAASALSISIRKLDELIACKKIVPRRIGRRVLVPPAELAKFTRGEPANRVA